MLGSCAATTPQTEFKHAEFRSVLPNGLRFVVIPDDTTHLVQVDVRYNVGSNQDPPGKAGLAHLVEHMQFQHRLEAGDKVLPPIFTLLPQIAVFFNAYTNWDTTHYMLGGVKEDLTTLLRLEAARMAAPCQKIPVEEFEREREVVRNEIRQRLGTPEGQIPQILLSEAYPSGHPYEQLIGGNDEQLSSITMSDVCEFLDKYYVPQNATVIVAGNVDHEKVADEIAFAFGEIKKGFDASGKPKEIKIDPIPPLNLEYHVVTRELDVPRPSVHVMWAMPERFGKDDQAAQFMIGMTAGNVSAANTDWNFATQVYPQVLGGAHAPLYVLSMELPNMGKLDEALDWVWRSAEKAYRPFEAGMFDKGKNEQKSQFLSDMEPLVARTNTVADMIQFNPRVKFDSNQEYLFDELRRIDELDGDRIRSWIKKHVKKSNAVVVVIKPKEGAARGDQRSNLKFSVKSHDKDPDPEIDPSEALRPLKVPSQKSKLSGAIRYKLGNGMNIVMLPNDKMMPVVAMQLVFNAGSAQEPGSMPGVAGMAARYLNPPLSTRVGGGIISVFGYLGAQINAGATDDYTVFSVRGLSIYTPQLIKALERWIYVGDYNQESIERAAKRFKTAHKLARVRQNEAYSRELWQAIWGPSHPYTVKGTATVASIGKIGRDELMSFKRKHYSAKNATFIIAGNFKPSEAREMISDTFADWGSGHRDKPVTEPHAARSGAKAIGVIGDDLPQMNVTIAYPAPAGVDGQAAARLVFTQMLNQKMASIRTELGSTYGMYARRRSMIGPSMYEMGGTVDALRAGEAIRVIREKFATMKDGDDFNLEFARARRIVLQRLLGASTESNTLVSRLAQMAIYGLNPDYHDKLTKYVAAVSPAQVKALIDAELRPENEVIVLLASKPMLEKAFTEAGINDVKYVDVQ